MLSNNLQLYRKAKGLSQDELAIQLNVVRQTVSKWEKGLSVPDAQMLICIADALDTSVNALLGESTAPAEQTEIKAIAAKLELLNAQLARQNESRRKLWRAVFIIIGCLACTILLLELAQWFWQLSAMKSLQDSAAIIGGADGPTAIMVAKGDFRLGSALLSLAALVAAIIGISHTRHR